MSALVVRFTLQSGRSIDAPAGPLGANSGLMHRNKRSNGRDDLFDHSSARSRKNRGKEWYRSDIGDK
jgi:hypothetical protein